MIVTKRAFCKAVLSASAYALAVGANASTYYLTDLGNRYIPSGINAYGEIVGTYKDPANNRAFYYNQGAYTLIPLLPFGVSNDARAINDNGLVAGWTIISNGSITPHATAYNARTGTVTDINGTNIGSFVMGVNQSGVFVGSSWGAAKAFTYPGTSYPSPIAPMGSSFGYAINDAGTFTGAATFGDPTIGPQGPSGWRIPWAPYNSTSVWLNGSGGRVNLGKLNGYGAAGYGINNYGTVAAAALTSTGGTVACYSVNHGPLTLIGNSPSSGVAWAVNDNNEIVGQYNGYAMIFSPGGAPADLNTLLLQPSSAHLDVAYGINANGMIVGQMTVFVNGIYEQHGFVLTPL
jgi:hypothetical protein